MSTLSKRWLEASPGRKWPYRTLLKLDKELLLLLHAHKTGTTLPPPVALKLRRLLDARRDLLQTVVIRRY